MVRGSLPAPLFGTREGAFSSPELGRVRGYLISCGTRQRKPFFAEIGGAAVASAAYVNSGSSEKSARPVSGKPSAPRPAVPVNGTSPIGKICPFFTPPKKRRRPPPSAAAGTLSPQVRQSRGAASPSPLPPSAKMSCAALRRMI